MYEIRLTKRVERQLSKLVPEVQIRLQIAIDALDENPRPDGVKKLKGKDNQYRIRVGDYRIIYTIEDQILLIVVVQLGARSDVYK
jgi:mRNA interferase RelE/StbE